MKKIIIDYYKQTQILALTMAVFTFLVMTYANIFVYNRNIFLVMSAIACLVSAMFLLALFYKYILFKYISIKLVSGWALFLILIYAVLVLKMISLEALETNTFLLVYGFAISVYLLIRFTFAYLYQPEKLKFDRRYQPTVMFGIPSKNEGENIYNTIVKIAESDYPKEKIEIIAVSDGSTDNTYDEMLRAKLAAEKMGVRVKVINWEKNRGKREGMGECIRSTKQEILVFIDSDSFVEKRTLQELVKFFYFNKTGAVTGHAYAANSDENALTKVQDLCYFISFKVFKSMESVFGSVTCCSGCCAAYRREYVLPILEEWLDEKFLGTQCTYGDDRSLTNALLKSGYWTLYSPKAVSYTVVPNNLKVFLKQQLRWKKSWIRTSSKAVTFMWRRNPIMSFQYYLGIVLTILGPFVVIRAIFVYPFFYHLLPLYYISGLLLIAAIYSSYYYLQTRDKKWYYGLIFPFVYMSIMIWQLPYAFLTVKDNKWGTR